MIQVKAPKPVPSRVVTTAPRVFLAGSIDMGKAVHWQERLVDHFKGFDVVFLNPRRDDFRVSEELSIDNPYFKEQVEWELDGLQMADLVVFYFDPKGQAPITLMELGLIAGTGDDAIVCCPEGYFRKGNVDIVCKSFGLNQVETLEELFEWLENYLDLL